MEEEAKPNKNKKKQARAQKAIDDRNAYLEREKAAFEAKKAQNKEAKKQAIERKVKAKQNISERIQNSDFKD